MSEASERLRLLAADHAPDSWPAVQMRDITAVLDELDAMHAAREATECEPYVSLVASIAKLTKRLETLRRQLGELYYSPALTMREGNSDLRLIISMMIKDTE